MNKKVKCIMLIDDNPDDNYFHMRIIKKSLAAEHIIVKESAKEALNYLNASASEENPYPNLIFLDLNMPGMNGWEFFEEYKKLDQTPQCTRVVIMLTSSENPEDEFFARSQDIHLGFRTKPLTVEVLTEILQEYWSKV